MINSKVITRFSKFNMLKSTAIFLTLILVEECFSAGDITLRNVQLERNKSGKLCKQTSGRVTCSVKGGVKYNLTATWDVNGGEASLGLRLLTVALKYSDGVGDHNNIHVCQETGGNFKFYENPCSIFIVATGEYPMDAYEFTIPHSGSKVEEQMTIQAFYKWSDDSSSTKPVGALGLKFKK